MSKVETDRRTHADPAPLDPPPAVEPSALEIAPSATGTLRARLAATGPLPRLAASGFARIAGISASLVGTQALTSVLGLLFWALAARQFAAADVGVAGAAVALMMLLGSLGSLGLGTVLIARLPGVPQGGRRVLVRTSVAAAAAAGALLGLVVPAAAVHVFGVTGLAPIAGSPLPLLLLAAGTGLTSAVMVLDQAVLTVGVGGLQLERNVTASAVKVVALLVLGLAGVHGGMTIFLAWAIGNALSLPLVARRTRGGRALADRGRLLRPAVLRGMGRLALSHHALNVSIQAALQLLPVLVTVLVSAEANADFNAAIMLAGFVFALPYAVTVGLFAAARGDESEVVSRMRLTIPFGLAVSLAANVVLFPLAGPLLHVFGPAYAAGGTDLLRLIVLAGLPFVIKDHFIALRRVQGRTSQALVVTVVFLVLELAAAAIGAALGGAAGLCIGWLAVLAVEALILAVPLVGAYRDGRGAAAAGAAPAASAAVAVPTAPVEEADIDGRPRTDADPEPDAAIEGRASVSDVEKTRDVAREGWWRRNLAGPVLTASAAGVLLMTAAANAGRAGDTGVLPQIGWTLGLAVVVLPAAVRLLARSTPGAERLLVAVGLGMVLQLSRLVLNPTMFAFHDELIHAETLRSIDETGRLYSFNSQLPVSAYYPGLEVVTDAVHGLTGLAAFPAAVVVLLLARLVLMLAVVGLVLAVSGSVRAAGVAVLIYVGNPQMLFFNSQYSYQTLALPLAVLAVYLVAVRRRGGRWSMVLPLAASAAVVLTHHLTAVLLIAAWAVWLVLVLVRGRAAGATPLETASRRSRSGRDRRDLAVLTLWTALLLALSVLVPGNPLAGYLGSIAGSSGADLFSLSQGKQTKALFSDSAGTGPAPWEQVLLIASVLIATAALLPALGFVRREWRAARPLALLLGLIALLYPLIPGGHVARATAEVGDRASGFVFVGLAAVVGVWWWRRARRTRTVGVVAGLATVLFLGSVVLGSGPASGQLPGPYEVSADARSVDADNVAAADFLAADVKAGSTVYGDRTSGALAAAVGDQRIVMHVSTGIDASRLLLAPGFTAADRALIRRAGLDYVVVDRRLATSLPHQQVYIESGEYGSADRTTPVTAGALAKLASVPGVERLYDNGALAVYDVRGLR